MSKENVLIWKKETKDTKKANRLFISMFINLFFFLGHHLSALALIGHFELNVLICR